MLISKSDNKHPEDLINIKYRLGEDNWKAVVKGEESIESIENKEGIEFSAKDKDEINNYIVRKEYMDLLRRNGDRLSPEDVEKMETYGNIINKEKKEDASKGLSLASQIVAGAAAGAAAGSVAIKPAKDYKKKTPDIKDLRVSKTKAKAVNSNPQLESIKRRLPSITRKTNFTRNNEYKISSKIIESFYFDHK